MEGCELIHVTFTRLQLFLLAFPLPAMYVRQTAARICDENFKLRYGVPIRGISKEQLKEFLGEIRNVREVIANRVTERSFRGLHDTKNEAK